MELAKLAFAEKEDLSKSTVETLHMLKKMMKIYLLRYG